MVCSAACCARRGASTRMRGNVRRLCLPLDQMLLHVTSFRTRPRLGRARGRRAGAAARLCLRLAPQSCMRNFGAARAAGGLVPPLYLHSSLHTEPRGRLSDSGPEVEWEHRMAQVSRNQARTILEPCACVMVVGALKAD